MALSKPKLTTYSSDSVGEALFKIHVLIREQILDENLGQIIKRSSQKFYFVLQHAERIKQNHGLIAVNSRMKLSNMPSA